MNISTAMTFAFDDAELGVHLNELTSEELDELDFGVIGFDAAGIVRAYNRHECEAAGLGAARVLGRGLFVEVAPCMNNFMVAHRFHDARNGQTALDTTIDYVLTLRMRPTRVRLRLIAAPGAALSFVLVRRLASR